MPQRTCATHGPLSQRHGRKDSWYCKPCKNERERAREAAKKDVPTTDGFHVRAMSTLYNAEGDVSQRWVKESRDAGDIAALLEAVKTIAEPFKGAHDPVAEPPVVDSDLLTIYPMGDPHLGLRAWAAEAGENFDLEIAERDLVAAVDRLVSVAPCSEEAIIAPLGDIFTADNDDNTTTAGTPQDVDSRLSKVLSVVVRLMRRCADRALQKHRRVIFKFVRGNHDETMSLVLAVCLGLYYERDPRVVVDQSPMHFLWHRFGKCLFGFTHGNRCKPHDLPAVMACDRKEDWGQTDHRHFYTCHVHHDSLKEFPGCTVETVRTLAAKDKYHASHGYRSGRDMKCDVWHREHGHVARHTIGIGRIRAGK